MAGVLLEPLQESFGESLRKSLGKSLRESFGESLLIYLLVSLCLIDAGGLGHRRIRSPGSPRDQRLRDSETLGLPKASWISRPQALPRTQLPPGAGCLRSRSREPEVSETASREPEASKTTGHRKPQKLQPIRSCSRGRPSSCSSGVNPKVRRGRRSRG